MNGLLNIVNLFYLTSAGFALLRSAISVFRTSMMHQIIFCFGCLDNKNFALALIFVYRLFKSRLLPSFRSDLPNFIPKNDFFCGEESEV